MNQDFSKFLESIIQGKVRPLRDPGSMQSDAIDRLAEFGIDGHASDKEFTPENRQRYCKDINSYINTTIREKRKNAIFLDST